MFEVTEVSRFIFWCLLQVGRGNSFDYLLEKTHLSKTKEIEYCRIQGHVVSLFTNKRKKGRGDMKSLFLQIESF